MPTTLKEFRPGLNYRADTRTDDRRRANAPRLTVANWLVLPQEAAELIGINEDGQKVRLSYAVDEDTDTRFIYIRRTDADDAEGVRFTLYDKREGQRKTGRIFLQGFLRAFEITDVPRNTDLPYRKIEPDVLSITLVRVLAQGEGNEL